MSLIIGRTCLSYCSRKVLKIASLPTPLREIGEMSADADRTDKLNVEHNTLDSEFYIRLGKGMTYYKEKVLAKAASKTLESRHD